MFLARGVLLYNITSYCKASFRLACAWCVRFPFASHFFKWVLHLFLVHRSKVKIIKLTHARTRCTPVLKYLKCISFRKFYMLYIITYITCPYNIFLDQCSGNPCRNGGICSSAGTTFRCTCTSGWMGPTCETRPLPPPSGKITLLFF